MELPAAVLDAIAQLLGKRCCRKRIGRGKSLSLGFGDFVSHSIPSATDSFYGEWEVGTYFSSWRILNSGKVLCGSSDAADSLEELDGRLQDISLGVLNSIEVLESHDIR